MAVIGAEEEYIPQSLESSIPSPVSTLPRNVSTIEGWETTHTTTDDATFYSKDEPRRVYWVSSSSEIFNSIQSRHVSIASSPCSKRPPPRRQKIRLSMGIIFFKKEECRSTPARDAASPYQPERHLNAREKLN